MPKGRKRTQADYDKEVLEAVKRMKKYPEHLRSARDNDTWIEFLNNHDVWTTDTKQGQDFWERVRQELRPTPIPIQFGITQRQLDEANARLELYKRILKSRQAIIREVYRNKETGRFVSKKSL